MTKDIDRERLLARFLRYVRIDTTAREDVTDYPSSPGQRELGALLRDELAAMGLADVEQDEHGLVHGRLDPVGASGDATVVFNAHVDTSPETTGAGVDPQVVEDYDGGDIVLPGDASRVIRVAENADLAALAGATLVTTDGTTLLGGDDKAGIAVIMEAVNWLVEHADAARCRTRVLFTCDEEIGRGVDRVDVAALGGTVCYTLDGHGAGGIDVATFSADLATITVRGVNIHPSIAKDRMINAVRVAADFIGRLPRETLAPEVASGEEGFLHPYSVAGGVEEVSFKVLLRDFETDRLADHAKQLDLAAAATRRAFPGAEIEIAIRKQYRNLADGLAGEPRAVGLAETAMRNVGMTPRRTMIRGGTDGSQFTERGLPTPNLSTGQHNPHSPLEWACLEEMERAAQVMIALVELWAAESVSPGGG